jgi:hypothetical protein
MQDMNMQIKQSTAGITAVLTRIENDFEEFLEERQLELTDVVSEEGSSSDGDVEDMEKSGTETPVFGAERSGRRLVKTKTSRQL